MKSACLFFLASFVAAPLGVSANAEIPTHAIGWEICQVKGSNGEHCRGSVKRVSSGPDGVHYTCSFGHKFFVKSKIRIR